MWRIYECCDLVQLIGLITNIFVLLIFAWAILTWIMPPYNPVREALDRIMERCWPHPSYRAYGGNDGFQPADPDGPGRIDFTRLINIVLSF